MDKKDYKRLKKIQSDALKKAVNDSSKLGKIFYYVGMYKIKARVGISGNHFTEEGFYWWNPLTWVFVFLLWFVSVMIFAFSDFWGEIGGDLKTRIKMDGGYIDIPTSLKHLKPLETKHLKDV